MKHFFWGTNRRFLLALASWTLLVALLVVMDYYRLLRFTQDIAISEARGHIQKNLAIRQWNAAHGGVYVPVSEATPPNPYLSHLPHRDITRPDGTRYTLMNPAYMFRQLNELFEEQYGIGGHVTSLKPIRPQNAPDSWEAAALHDFEKGAPEVMEFQRHDGLPYLRLMIPMQTSTPCLRCHAGQGYKEGDIRGGVSVTLPLGDLAAGQWQAFRQQLLLFMLLWLLGVFFILFQGRLRFREEEKTRKTISELQLERDRFIHGPVITITWQNHDDWRMEQVSANAADILGYPLTGLLDGSIPYRSLIHPGDLERVAGEISAASTSGGLTVVHAPYRLRTATGSLIWVQDHTNIIRDESGQVTQYQGYLIDITEPMHLAEALRENRDHLEMAIQGANLGTWEWEIASGKVLFNKRWAEMLGYSLQEIAPHVSAWEALLHPEDRELALQLLNEHLSGKTQFYKVECRLRHKSGSWVWVLDVGRVQQWDGKGRAIRAVGIHMDITSQKEAELALLAAKEQAEAASRAKSVLLSNMSHELRTPLNAILGYTQLLQHDETLDQKQHRGVQTIHQAGEHLLQLINDVLDLAKIEAGRTELLPTCFRLQEFMSDIVTIMEVQAAAKQLSFRTRYRHPLPVLIVADALRLRQILLNLLSNALKFTQKGHCTLGVAAGPVTDGKVALSFAVEDSGPGIATEKQQAVFEPFYQGGGHLQHSEGSGLGLSISKKLVTLMGGNLEIASPLDPLPPEGQGPGSRFQFTVEVGVAAQDCAQPGAALRITGFTGWDGRPCERRLLLVDDQESNRAVLRDTLEPLGFVISEATDGQEALASCLRQRPDAVLMDLRMPVMDGYEATRRIKAHSECASLPVIAITASILERDQLRGRDQEHGFSACLGKPFVTMELLQTLADLLQLRLTGSAAGSEPSGEEPLTVPPPEICQALLRLSASGDIGALSSRIEDLAGVESGRYRGFCYKLQGFVDDFQLLAMEQFIQSQREQ